MLPPSYTHSLSQKYIIANALIEAGLVPIKSALRQESKILTVLDGRPATLQLPVEQQFLTFGVVTP
jgi:hypothetical protein